MKPKNYTGSNDDRDQLSSDERPIGIFDSGLGGLTVLGEIIKALPRENTIYFGDSGRAPYGTKSPETIARFSEQDANFLVSKNVKMIVIACNTASSHAYSRLKEKFDLPVVEVITPGSIAAIEATENGKIGIIGTTATVSSGIYDKTIQGLSSTLKPELDIEIFSKACPLFVGLAEEGWWNDEITFLTAKKYLTSLMELEVDSLVLACTHYPLLKNTIAKVMGPEVRLIDSGAAVAGKVLELLKEKNMLNLNSVTETYREFYTSDSEEKFLALGRSFLKNEIKSAKKVDIECY